MKNKKTEFFYAINKLRNPPPLKKKQKIWNFFLLAFSLRGGLLVVPGLHDLDAAHCADSLLVRTALAVVGP